MFFNPNINFRSNDKKDNFALLVSSNRESITGNRCFCISLYFNSAIA